MNNIPTNLTNLPTELINLLTKLIDIAIEKYRTKEEILDSSNFC